MRIPQGATHFDGIVHDIFFQTEVVAVCFSAAFHAGWTHGLTFHLRCVPNRNQLVRLHDAIDRVADSPALLQLLFPKGPVPPAAANAADRRRVDIRWSDGINAEQRQAVRQVVLGTDVSAPYLLQGPPGTGKVRGGLCAPGGGASAVASTVRELAMAPTRPFLTRCLRGLCGVLCV